MCKRFQFNINSVQTTTMLFLLRSMSTYLGLEKPPAGDKQGGYSSVALERMRAYLGVYYVVVLYVHQPTRIGVVAAADISQHLHH